jgi:26S proteasome regulatory subunit N8
MPPPEEVIVHPLVLLGAVDHYNRVAKDTKKRVVGVLLGSTFKGKCHVVNSFAGVWIHIYVRVGAGIH